MIDYDDGFAFPKRAAASQREQTHARYRKLRPELRRAAWQADQERCIFPSCRRWVALECAHIHEVVFRSAQGDPCDIENAVTLCGECHGHLHVRVGGALKRIEGSRSAGLRFYLRRSWREAWREVR